MTALVLTLSKIVRILRLDLKVSTTQRDFPIAKGPHKFFNYEFPKDVAGRKFLTCYLVCNVNYPRERWWKRNGRCRPTQAGKIGYFASVASFYPKFLLRYPLFFSERPSASVRLSAHEKSVLNCSMVCGWTKSNDGLLVRYNSSLLSFAVSPDFHCVLPICERKKVEKTKSSYLNVKGIYSCTED